MSKREWPPIRSLWTLPSTDRPCAWTPMRRKASCLHTIGTRALWRTGSTRPGITITNTVLKERETCFGCAIRCKGVVDIPGKADPSYGGPEYETCSVFGSYCGNTDLGDICHANQLCNMYGIDTISCGATIAWAMDCFEQGILTTADTDGIELKYGNGESVRSP